MSCASDQTKTGDEARQAATAPSDEAAPSDELPGDEAAPSDEAAPGDGLLQATRLRQPMRRCCASGVRLLRQKKPRAMVSQLKLFRKQARSIFNELLINSTLS